MPVNSSAYLRSKATRGTPGKGADSTGMAGDMPPPHELAASALPQHQQAVHPADSKLFTGSVNTFGGPPSDRTPAGT